MTEMTPEKKKWFIYVHERVRISYINGEQNKKNCNLNSIISEWSIYEEAGGKYEFIDENPKGGGSERGKGASDCNIARNNL